MIEKFYRVFTESIFQIWNLIRALLWPDTSVECIPIIVSLTTYGPRLTSCLFAVASIRLQSVQPKLLVLNIAPQDYQKINVLVMACYKRLRVEFNVCEDIRSYKKLNPIFGFLNTRKLTEITHIVTIDDDVFYAKHFLSTLSEHNAFKDDQARFGTDAKLTGNQPYLEWKPIVPTHRNQDNVFLIGAGGISYPLGYIEHLEKEDSFFDIAPTTDDIWYHFVSIKYNFNNYYVPFFENTRVRFSNQRIGLKNKNLLSSNDLAIKKCQKFFHIELK